MVKNVTGGNKHKSQARKFTNPSAASKKLRTAEEEGEIYAQVTKMLGNGMCHVQTIEGKTMLCIIRGKFRGRGKRDNIISVNTWVLVGLREWESEKESTPESKDVNKCDLLEVYSDLDKEKLKNIKSVNWQKFIENDCGTSSNSKGDELFTFDRINNHQEYEELMTKSHTNLLDITNSESVEEINVDDI